MKDRKSFTYINSNWNTNVPGAAERIEDKIFFQWVLNENYHKSVIC